MKKGRIAAVTAAALIISGGGALAVQAYLSGNQFEPGSFSQMLQANQIVFPEDADKAGKKENGAQEESSVWEKVDDADRQDRPKSTGGAGYLLENGQEVVPATGNISMTGNAALSSSGNVAEGAAPAMAAAGSAGTSYRLVGDASDADLVIQMPGNVSGTGAGNGQGAPSGSAERSDSGSGSSSSGSSGNGGGSSSSGASGSTENGGSTSDGKKNDLVIPADPSVKPDPPKKDEEKPDPLPGIPDPVVPSEKPKPDMGGWGAPPYSFPEEGLNEDDVSSNGVVIGKGYSSNYNLYRGQKITEKNVFYALETFVWGKDYEQYAWGDSDYNRFIRIDGISFDGGETWVSFPVQIPEDVDSEEVIIKVSYRLNEKNDWTEVKVPYEVEDSRILVLSQKCEQKDSISSDLVLNPDGYNQYLMENSRLNLFGMQNGILDTTNKLTSLFPGWEENGEPVSWLYPAETGLHILEPMDPVPLDSDTCYVYLESYYLDDMDALGTSGFAGWFQTLKGYDYFATEGELEVPEYIQAIDFVSSEEDGVLWNPIQTISVPDSVLYINTKSKDYYVNEAWKVSEENLFYSSDQDGFLYNKEETKLLGIPYEKKGIVIPKTIREVSIPYYNDLKTIRLEAETMDELPEMDCTNLRKYDTNVILKEDLMDSFLAGQMKNFTEETGNTVSPAENPELRYFALNDGSVINEEGALHSLLTSGTSAELSDRVKSVEKEAFRKADGLQVLRLSSSGETVEWQKDALKNSSIRQILCYTQEQYDSVNSQLARAGASDIQVSLIETKTNKEGYQYFQQETEEGILTILKKAPKNVVTFDSAAITDDDGNTLVISDIAAEAFADCTQLQWVDLAESTKKIGGSAFKGCTALSGALIRSTDTIEIGDQSFDGCPSMRFLASNAQECVRENGYEPNLNHRYNDATQSFFFIPSYSFYDGDRPEDHGYPASGIISFTFSSNVSSYELVETGDKGRVLYGVGWPGWGWEEIPWLALRSVGTLDSEVQLPETTVEIFSYAFAEAQAESGSFTVNWSELSDLKYLDAGAFQSSSLGGEVSMSETSYLGDFALSGCDITSLRLDCMAQIGESALTECRKLEKITIGSVPEENYLASYAFTGSDNLREIEVLSAEPPLLLIYWYTNMPFRFNDNWSQEEELANLRVKVPEGTELTFLEKWLYTFVGQENFAGLKTRVRRELADQDPTNEEVLAECNRRLLEAENRIRTHLGLETVDELTYPPEELLEQPTEDGSPIVPEAGQEKEAAADAADGTSPNEKLSESEAANEKGDTGVTSDADGKENADEAVSDEENVNPDETNAGSGSAGDGSSREEPETDGMDENGSSDSEVSGITAAGDGGNASADPEQEGTQ